jgi:hypothetical protein
MKAKIIQKIQSALDSMKNDTVNNEIKTKYKKGSKYMSEKTIEEKIEKLLKEKHTGTSSDGILIYNNLNSNDIKKIIAEVSLDLVNKFEQGMDNASDEWEGYTVTNQTIKEVQEKYSPQKKKIKLK